MPDDYGRFRAFRGTGQELPWLQTFEPGQRVRITATQQHGTVARHDHQNTVLVHLDGLVDALPAIHEPGELRPLDA